MPGKVDQFFQNIIAKLKSFWTKDAEPKLEQLYDDVAPELKTLLASDVDTLGTAVYAGIKVAAAAGKTPEDWLDVAYDIIKAKLPELGKQLSSTGINLLATLFQGHAKAAAVAAGTTVQAIIASETSAAPAT